MRVILVFIWLTILSVSLTMAQKIDIQGHRGARGMYPENSIPAFIYAIQQGVTTLELDVVISADGQVVVSHEPWMNENICQGPSGEAITADHERWNIYQMSYDEIERFDCGSRGNPNFSQQKRIPVAKPLLADVIREAERYMKGHTGYAFDYNIEIKSTESGDNVFHPAPEQFSDLVYSLINEYLPWERVVIQSFDFRVLQYWNKKYPMVRLAALVENMRPLETNLGALGFTPDIYSPDYRLLNEKAVKELHARGIRVIPWTVNDLKTMDEVLGMGVDGLITDYPNIAAEAGLTVKFNTKE